MNPDNFSETALMIWVAALFPKNKHWGYVEITYIFIVVCIAFFLLPHLFFFLVQNAFRKAQLI